MGLPSICPTNQGVLPWRSASLSTVSATPATSNRERCWCTTSGKHLGLTGTNIGCDTSSCGACSLHIDGEAVKSCTVLAVQADGHDITTIEGMAAADGTLHPMQQAFMENHGLQCGYCTPGMVMAATSLLKENPHPTEHDVRIGLEGNLCRCTGYHNIVLSVLAAAGK